MKNSKMFQLCIVNLVSFILLNRGTVELSHHELDKLSKHSTIRLVIITF